LRPPEQNWLIHHVTLDAYETDRRVFSET